MSAHVSQAFSIVHCTDSEDLPLIYLVIMLHIALPMTSHPYSSHTSIQFSLHYTTPTYQSSPTGRQFQLFGSMVGGSVELSVMLVLDNDNFDIWQFSLFL